MNKPLDPFELLNALACPPEDEASADDYDDETIERILAAPSLPEILLQIRHGHQAGAPAAPAIERRPEPQERQPKRNPIERIHNSRAWKERMRLRS